jgi:hypothetical protein
MAVEIDETAESPRAAYETQAEQAARPRSECRGSAAYERHGTMAYQQHGTTAHQ